MKKILPILVFISCLFFIFPPQRVNAVTGTPTPAPTTPTNPQGALLPTPVPAIGEWVEDPNVTFVGKTAARSGEFLDWALRTYDWSFVTTGQRNPLIPFWTTVRNIVYAFFLLFVLITALVVIITRGRSITIKKFIPRFIGIVLLVTFSFAILQFIYQITDLIQGFFLRNPDQNIPSTYISQKNLLSVAFDYQSFLGYRRFDPSSNESAFISLLLVKLTAVTYYVMVGILLLRKIILWFFIVVSPIFPLLLLYYPVRNTGKIWIGEFFRWVLYAPLFAIFLQGLVTVWRTGIPMAFSFQDVNIDDKIVYPTAINILLGGPGQILSLSNSVNLPDTFALYVVALLMLWVVILLPFILLQIFLDYLHNFNFAENNVIKQLINSSNSLYTKVVPPKPQPPPPPSHGGAGLARPIPAAAKIEIPAMRPMSPAIQRSAEILNQTNLHIPTLRDVAKFESSAVRRDAVSTQAISQTHETLRKIGNPNLIATPAERTKYNVLREKLVLQKQKGDPVAASILSAVNQTQTHAVMGATGAGGSPMLPTVNRIQSVSLDDYEAVRKMWEDNYQNLEVPNGADRKEWIRKDKDKITLAVNLLTSLDPAQNKQGLEMVGQILPFLLIGGFSKTEVTAYLKAKLEAAKTVEGNLEKKEQEEESLLSTHEKKETASKTMTQHAEVEEKLPPENEHEVGMVSENKPLTTEPINESDKPDHT